MPSHPKFELKSLLLTAVAFVSSVNGSACKPNSTEYEYVVVGSGPGGGPLAAKLARAGHSVFLIEAGQDYGDQLVQEIPAWWIGSTASPQMSWHFYVEHYRNETQARRDNKYVYKFENGTTYHGLNPPEGVAPLGILYPRGSSLGGSGQSNAGNFLLPPDGDWDYIAKLTGDESWSPERMREHFINIEKNEYIPSGTKGHGFDGYLSTNQNNLTSVLDRPGIIDIARQGLRLVEGIEVANDEELATLLQRDNNRDDPTRFHKPAFLQNPVHVTSKRKRSSARDLVADTLAARNEDGTQKYPLTVSFNSLASRILFGNNPATKGKPKAVGVEYLYGEALYSADQRYNPSTEGELRTVLVSKEVIVSGGAFNTPQILKLSGIGPKEELKAHGIPVVVDLPAVGSNLHDHKESGVSLRAKIDWPRNPLEGCLLGQTANPNEDHCLAEWINAHIGIYGEAGTPLSFSYRSSVAETDDVDIQYFGTPGFQFIGFQPDFQLAGVEPDVIGWSVVKLLGRDTAGTVQLRSSNPRDTPVINFNWFEGPGGELDLQAMTEGVQNLLNVMDAVGEPYTPYESIQPIPGLEMKQSIADTVFSHHATSTCRIGPKANKEYCVDSKFKVNGVDGLRVVDASIFPYSPGAYPIASVFIVSEKAFQDIIHGY